MTGLTSNRVFRLAGLLLLGGVAALAGAALSGLAMVQDPLVPTTTEDFHLPGTQPPGEDFPITIEPFVGVFEGSCVNCHGVFPPEYQQAEPFRNWAASMMGQSMRDPVFRAAMTVANQDAGFAGDLCLRCHTPAGWIGGRSDPPDGSGLSEPADFEGVTCHVCHRLVDPVYEEGVSPAEDVPILEDLAALGLLPSQFGTARMVFDPLASVRRGPRDGVNHPQGADAIFSPFHSDTDVCATCHDVSNPVFSRQQDGSYLPNELNTPHPTGDKYDMFPVERTYSEWLMSDFALQGVDLGGRFGGNHATGVMRTCQDCHMPDRIGPIARNATIRQDTAQHAFNGAMTWQREAIRDIYPDAETGLTDQFVLDAEQRTIEMLQAASDMALSADGSTLTVRITNYSGHKLPSGYPEGRRMWLNVRFFDEADVLIAERGAYDFNTALLNTSDTKVYETHLGLDETMSDITGIPAGVSFHFALNNVRIKDNRIPPIGFDNASFEAVQADPVGYAYADGQHWDETPYMIPEDARRAAVTLYYQSNSREYIEFLRDENHTDDFGQELYDLWAAHGRSEPIVMDQAEILFESAVPADLTGFAVDTGVLLDGDLAALGESDDVYLHTRSGFGQTFVDLHNMTMRISAATAVNGPSELDISVEWFIDEPSGQAQIALRNWSTGQFQRIYSGSIGSTETTATVEGVAAGAYVNASGEMEARLRHIVFVPFFAFTFDSFIDHVEIAVE